MCVSACEFTLIAQLCFSLFFCFSIYSLFPSVSASSCHQSHAGDWIDIMIVCVVLFACCQCVCPIDASCPLGSGVLVVVFGLCWAPFHVDRLMWSYIDTSSDKHLKIFEHVHIISGVCFYLSSAINPIVYNLMSTRFREMFCHVTCYSNSWPMRSSLQMTQRSTLSEKMPSSMKLT